ncbi:MAG: 4a-hydroxytetrahydrobiopterin dehydratase [Halobacteria archaeon]|nr:4a-hydroxytetrahydrobiopterin dehydratase [Halobacteria archaeon]
MTELASRECKPYPKGTPALSLEQATELLREIPGWSINSGSSAISRAFRFKDFHQTMAFVNALAWIAHQTDHHPDLEVGYNRCNVTFSTHSIGGLSDNDFICAARINSLGEL